MRTAGIAMGMALLAALAACGRGQGDASASAAPRIDPAFAAGQQAWRDQRREELLRPDGWTSLVGLHWLELKAHYVGSGERIGNGVRFAFGPERMGMVSRDARGGYWFTPEDGVELTLNGEPLKGRVALHGDHAAAPAVIGFDEGKGQVSLIRRGSRHALRVKHADAPTRLQFAGLEYWPADPSWRIEGRFVPNPVGSTLSIGDVIGVRTDTSNPGAVEFERDGVQYRLEALGEPGRELFFVLADRTSGHGSYPAGRFLDAAWPGADGKVVLDFNRAYNPPCAFTLFATCPLPPPQNRLDLAIAAGEKTYVSPVHR
ncbi:hypothetical protein B1992_01560 [Pseudoxanthomonas broegbernensis]|uniref:DUF1684 domain-containing protein n=1 Tax=Pseudoxanthomonas broegbernensis TaxID=83619 RepID=A0A7V8K8B4_9GAMM|nr:DUF1684 domain-containing protein [Pseudoxanthomonas broegbernensis]KAF1688130.1 hypothetical protein B1992_01560 [Pseudoxanthomonas broegbernensis]MBB6065178.1 hypothetical protein [Pseudoxanthomonas broegbernensis]